MSDLLVSIQMKFPMLDRAALASHLAPIVEQCIAAGGITTNLSIQPYDEDGDPDA